MNFMFFRKGICFYLNDEISIIHFIIQKNCMGISLTLKSITCFSIILFSFIPTLASTQLHIKQYPLADDYFDKIYIIHEGSSIKYLHAYCKQSNTLSLSLTSSLQFQEQPRFPIYPLHSSPPRMQEKYYTFFDACNIKLEISNGTHNSQLVKVIRRTDNSTVFTINSVVKRAGDYTIIESKDTSKKWGMGERFQKKFEIKDGIWSVWNRDRPFQIDLGRNGRSGQTYGHQPVYLARQNSGFFHMIYFKTTHAFNLEASQSTESMKYHYKGENVQFVIFIGDKNPQTLLKKYHQFIGPAHIPPFWAMGHHQSRWGYKNFNMFSDVVKQFKSNQIPLDTMWSDLDYMKNKSIFTLDETAYPSDKMKNLLQQNSLHYIPLIDVGVCLEDHVAIAKGRELDVFLKSKKHPSNYYEAVVWPGRVHFVDYLHPNSSLFWESQLDRLYKKIPFSGIWLDMNEPSNFQGNEPVSETYRVQYSESINMMTIDVNLDHYSEDEKPFKHSQVHAYFGHLSTIPTYKFLKKHGRPFIVSRSNSVGSGAYAAHWTGDNTADWDFLRLSVSGNFLFQIFGVQMVGADICGFHKNTNEQLCSRWMQLGSFYPFSRNHNENESISQEPWVFGDKLLLTAQISLRQRYSLLKQMYTTLVNLNGAGSFYRPIFFQFFQDSLAFNEEYVETQFLIGDYLMGAPIVEKDQENRKVYFPGDGQLWYQLHYENKNGFNSANKMKGYSGRDTADITNILPSPLQLFLRAGKLIFTNAAEMRTVNLTNTFTLVAALKQGKAEGQILAVENYSSNDQMDQCIEKGCNLKIKLVRESDLFKIFWTYEGSVPFKNEIVIDKVRAVDSANDYVSKNSAVKIHSTTGEQILNLNQL